MNGRLRFGDFFSARTRSAQFGSTDWEEIADSLGVSVDHSLGGGDAFFGSRGELAVAIGRVVAGDRFVTRYRIHYPAFEFGLQMLGRDHEPAFEPRRLPVVSTGWEGLDSLIVTRTDDEEALRRWLSDDKANLLRDLFRAYRPIEVTSIAMVHESQLTDSVDQLVQKGRDLIASASALRVMPAVVEQPTPPPARLDILGEPRPPAAVDEPVAGRAPDQAPEAAIPTPPTLDTAVLDRIVTTMFSGNALSFAVDRELEDLIGSRVRWEGSLRSLRAYTSDLDLGSIPGTKATVTVRQVTGESAGSSLVDATVGLPSDTGSGIERGDPVVIEGTIARIDSLMRSIVLADGTIALR
ncbi:MAG TPA: hypothetical protein VGC47_07305 [Acidimicrobiia bacterium]